MLQQELKKIDARKKEREKKAQDLQRLMTNTNNSVESRKQDKRQTPRKRPQNQIKVRSDSNVSENAH